jgi:hypothetical protein
LEDPLLKILCCAYIHPYDLAPHMFKQSIERFFSWLTVNPAMVFGG